MAREINVTTISSATANGRGMINLRLKSAESKGNGGCGNDREQLMTMFKGQ